MRTPFAVVPVDGEIAFYGNGLTGVRLSKNVGYNVSTFFVPPAKTTARENWHRNSISSICLLGWPDPRGVVALSPSSETTGYKKNQITCSTCRNRPARSASPA